MNDNQSSAKRVALVTGVSRRIGIGAAIVRRLTADGLRVMASGWPSHDDEMPWPSDPSGPDQLLNELRSDGAEVNWEAADLGGAGAAAALVDRTVELFGSVDVVVATHARSSHASLDTVTAKELDLSFQVNARACVLLAKAFGQAFDASRCAGRLILFTSGQHLEALADEIAYAVSKGAVHQMTRSLSDALVDRGITVNCINPGPVDTGYLEGEQHAAVARRFPSGRWGRGDDLARVVSWLASDESAWVTGQVIDAEGGFRR